MSTLHDRDRDLNTITYDEQYGDAYLDVMAVPDDAREELNDWHDATHPRPTEAELDAQFVQHMTELAEAASHPPTRQYRLTRRSIEGVQPFGDGTYSLLEAMELARRMSIEQPGDTFSWRVA